MSCNHCNTKFNFFHKEVGCANCGMSFCNKCLKQKCKIPSKGPGEYNVCKTCFLKTTTGVSSTSQTAIAPPDAYLKRLEALENPAAPPITMYKHDKKLQSLRTGLSAADQQLIDRLEKLKDQNKDVPDEDELQNRLAHLKGENNYVEGPSRNVLVPDTRSDQEKVDSLMEQFVSEREIELAHNPEERIVARLATLREQGVRPNEGTYVSNLHDSSGSEGEVDRIAKKIMDEVALDERNPIASSNKNIPAQSDVSTDDPDDIEMSNDELPWCVLCNKDARYRCLDCGDLYCAECNTEVHKTWGDTDHRVVEFKQN